MAPPAPKIVTEVRILGVQAVLTRTSRVNVAILLTLEVVPPSFPAEPVPSASTVQLVVSTPADDQIGIESSTNGVVAAQP